MSDLPVVDETARRAVLPLATGRHAFVYRSNDRHAREVDGDERIGKRGTACSKQRGERALGMENSHKCVSPAECRAARAEPITYHRTIGKPPSLPELAAAVKSYRTYLTAAEQDALRGHCLRHPAPGASGVRPKASQRKGKKHHRNSVSVRFSSPAHLTKAFSAPYLRAIPDCQAARAPCRFRFMRRAAYMSPPCRFLTYHTPYIGSSSAFPLAKPPSPSRCSAQAGFPKEETPKRPTRWYSLRQPSTTLP